MKKRNVNRREALKILGSMGASVFASTILNQPIRFRLKAGETRLPNIIIMVFDALSARHMSLYGYKRNTTPNIEDFAKSSIVYRRHYSASNFTQSSTASMLTGVYPWTHRSLEFFELLLNSYEAENIFSGLSSHYQTIAYTHNIHVMNILEQFRSYIKQLKPIEDLVLFSANKLESVFENDKLIAEYATKRWLEDFLSSSYSLFLNPLFTTVSAAIRSTINDQYKELYPVGLSERDEYLFKMEDAIDWIGDVTRTTSKPFFGYFHLLPPHEDYKPRKEFYNKFALDQFRLPAKPEHFFTEGITEEEQRVNSQRYDEYVAHVDAEFGRLIRKLAAQRTLDNTYLILTSDHGQLFERGVHGHLQPILYESVIHTPLIIHTPGQTESINITSPTSSLDLVPTILRLSGEPLHQHLEGKILPGLGGEENQERIIFSMQARQNAKYASLAKVTFAAIQWPFKLIWYRGYNGFEDVDELFNLENDPEELINLAQEKQSVVLALKEELRNNQTLAEEKSLET